MVGTPLEKTLSNLQVRDNSNTASAVANKLGYVFTPLNMQLHNCLKIVMQTERMNH